MRCAHIESEIKYERKDSVVAAASSEAAGGGSGRVHAVYVVHNNNIKTIIITIIVRAFTLFLKCSPDVSSRPCCSFLETKKPLFYIKFPSAFARVSVCKCTLAASVCLCLCVCMCVSVCIQIRHKPHAVII